MQYIVLPQAGGGSQENEYGNSEQVIKQVKKNLELSKKFPTFASTNKTRKNMEYDLVRLGYGFKEYLDCDVDEYCHRDIVGVNVYDAGNGELLGSVDFTTLDEIEDMETDELIDWLADNNF